MATLIPSLNASLRRMTGGERRFAQRLIEKLEDDYCCWYDVPIGVATRHPDFVLLSPRRGVLILEVKDWKLETIARADKAQFTIHTDAGLKKIANPFEQARQYAHAVVNVLQQDPQLQQADGTYKGRLCVPFGYGVVLANITRKAFESAQLDAVIEPHRVICRDEMGEGVDDEVFQKRLWNMFTVQFGAALTMPQIDRVRWHLFPEIRVQPEQLALGGVAAHDDAGPAQLPDLLRVMDMQQEQLARSLGEGHRVIHGVAGSGKTLILGFRCERLAPVLPKPVLVLCYNKTLATKLQDVIRLKKLDQKVNVRTFHSWCFDQLRLYNVVMPQKGDSYFDQLVESVIRGVEKGQIPRAQYGAVMIDEGHDFRPEWLKLVAQMVDPEINSLLVLYDDAQSIYGGKSKRKFSFSSLGIQAQGRTTILRLNYRNTAEILGAAYEFAKEYIRPEQAEEDGVPLIQPESAGRHGLPPELQQFPTLAKEGSYLAEQFRQINRGGRPWRDMAVVYRTAFIGEEITKQLQA
ncbi:MAG: NERD domain-containing protein, partial [Burkholderiales bacterium]